MESEFKHVEPLFSKEFTKDNLKAKMVRVVLVPGGPVEVNDIRYNHMRDRQEQ